ncbi:unnamed protein product [Citrullus colocynthis]|uniref:Protein kinase domain-containing protein n=1 Tax=Citrullus colocynthis TaxID=252529 RepID=A0ABP0XW81_9ROSI
MESFASLVVLPCLILGVLFGACDSISSNEVIALGAFRSEVFEDPYQVFSNWNSLQPDPCLWSGISCSPTGDHVVKINISHSALKGFLSEDLGQLSFLEELILHGNKLHGPVPKELGCLKNLRILDLGMNQFTGPIPPEFGNLTKLVKINLQSNEFTGQLPPELGNLRYLEELRLDRNKLGGTVGHSDHTGLYVSKTNLTGFCGSSQLRVADFSYNFFVGSIPKCLERLPGSSFQGNCLHKNNSKQRPLAQCAMTKSHPGSNRPNHHLRHQVTSKPIWLLTLEIVTGTLVGSLFLVAVLTAVQKFNRKSSMILPWKKAGSRKYYAPVCIDPEILKDVTRFSRQELELACEDFSNIIGSSRDSLVYKGTMKTGPEIAVISMSMKEEQWTGYLELYFQTEVADLSRINHENTGKLLGYCRESTPFTRMLVFEYASNGTLYEHLHYGEACQLSWTRRMKIILGIARGLKYLHTELQPPFTISDLNSNSVYLTDDFFPKLIDFESWKTILSRSEKNSGSIGSQGAICVLPNSLEARHLDVQGNIYAFGVLLLEIISGRPLYCKDKGNLVDWAKDYIEMPEVMSYVVDPELKHFRYEDLEVICEVANLCIHQQPTKPLSMKELCTMLETRIDTSVAIEFKASSLAWAELALS